MFIYSTWNFAENLSSNSRMIIHIFIFQKFFVIYFSYLRYTVEKDCYFLYKNPKASNEYPDFIE